MTFNPRTGPHVRNLGTFTTLAEVAAFTAPSTNQVNPGTVAYADDTGEVMWNGTSWINSVPKTGVLPVANGGWGADLVTMLPATYGSVGNGSTDDTTAFQAALTAASNGNGRILLGAGANYKITNLLFMWGRCSIANADESNPGTITLAYGGVNYPYAINFGISAFKSGASNFLQAPWSGTIEGIVFTISSSTGAGRLLYFWLTNGGKLYGNTFNLAASQYSATSSGNDAGYVVNSGSVCIRRNIEIVGNVVNATADSGGSEGFGLNSFYGGLIARNIVQGVGDDMVGLHACKNIRVIGNDLRGTDGRVFLGNCQNIEVAGNTIARMPQNGTGTWFNGVALIYSGWEITDSVPAGTYAPDYIDIHDNTCVYPVGAIDAAGGGITTYGARHTRIANNAVICNASGVGVHAIYIQPQILTGSNWTDPDGRSTPGLVSKVFELDVAGNSCVGAYPRPITQSGLAANYTTALLNVAGNTAPALSIYGQGTILNRSYDNVITQPDITDASGTLYCYDQHGTSGIRFANTGAVAAWHYILQPALVGMKFSFSKQVAQTMDVHPDGTETINAGSAGGILTLTNVGSSVTLECLQAGKWIVTQSNGAYTVA